MKIETLTKEELENVKKFPWQWAIMVLCAAISTVFGLYVVSRNKEDENCERHIANLRKVAFRKDSIILEWQTKYINLSTELLYKNNIIDRQNQVIQNTDSLARDKFEKKAKQIITQNE